MLRASSTFGSLIFASGDRRRTDAMPMAFPLQERGKWQGSIIPQFPVLLLPNRNTNVTLDTVEITLLSAFGEEEPSVPVRYRPAAQATSPQSIRDGRVQAAPRSPAERPDRKAQPDGAPPHSWRRRRASRSWAAFSDRAQIS